MGLVKRGEELWHEEKSAEGEINVVKIDKIIVEKETEFQDVLVCETPVYGRVLFLDNEVQSAQADEFIYHESLIHPVMVMHQKPESILIMGAGEGATARELFKHNTVKEITAVDIDKDMMDITKNYLEHWHQGAINDSRYSLLIQDARKYVENTDKKFDIIISDLTDPLEDSQVGRLYTKEFYQIMKTKMNTGGFFVAQANTIDPEKMKTHSSIVKTLKEVFKNVRSYCAYVESFKSMWAFIIASDNEIEAKDIDKILESRNVSGLKFYDEHTHQRMFTVPKYGVKNIKEQGRVLTDDMPMEGIYS